MVRTMLAGGLLVLALAAPASAQQDKSTSWKISVDMTMTQPMNMTMPNYTTTSCGPADPLQQSPPMENGDCTLEDIKRSDSRLSYRVVCNMHDTQMTGEGWAEKVDEDHYKGHMTFSGNSSGVPMAMAMDYQGTRLGPCTEDSGS